MIVRSGDALTAEERTWLDHYRRALHERHPGAVTRMVIFGSKARGQAHGESDLDLLLIVTNEAGPFKRKIRRIGYDLAAGSELLPSILVYTEQVWERRRRSGSPFWKAVARDAVPVL